MPYSYYTRVYTFLERFDDISVLAKRADRTMCRMKRAVDAARDAIADVGLSAKSISALYSQYSRQSISRTVRFAATAVSLAFDRQWWRRWMMMTMMRSERPTTVYRTHTPHWIHTGRSRLNVERPRKWCTETVDSHKFWYFPPSRVQTNRPIYTQTRTRLLRALYTWNNSKFKTFIYLYR